MCGIGGILRVTPPGEAYEPIPDAWLDAIDAAIAWRGPDGSGRFRDKIVRPDGTTVEVALVHRRLSIIDHQGGAQPMVREGESGPRAAKKQELVAVVFNGCIYNHRELRRELEAGGSRFESDHSDTEVIAQQVLQARKHGAPIYGDRDYELYQGFDGMYAAAIWARSDGTLVLLADQFIEKPLLIWQAGNERLCAFASSPAPLSNLSAAASLNAHERGSLREAIANWIVFGCHSRPPYPRMEQPDDISRVLVPTPTMPTPLWHRVVEAVGLIPLLPFLLIIVSVGLAIIIGVTFARAAVQDRKLRLKHLDEFDRLLEAAVAERLEADVPLGCFLSGGIDSSLIAHYAKKSLGRLTTLCVRMPDARYDESGYAQRVADHLGTDHITLDVEPSAADDLVHLINLMGLPFGDSSILPTYWLCKAARRHVKVALSGDGGDEMFMGYSRYAAARWLPLARLVAWAMPRDDTDHPDPTQREAKEARFWNAARGAGYTDLVSIFPSEMQRELFVPFTSKDGAKWRPPRAKRRFMGRFQARNFDVAHYLPADLLRKTDTASMACGLEVRCPFLDNQLAAAARTTPISRLMRGNTPKALLRELASRYLPPEIVNRPKQGFAIPISDWFRSDFGGLRACLFDHLAGERPFGFVHDEIGINMAFVRRLIDEHWAAGSLTPPGSSAHVRARDHGQRLFSLLSLAIWARQEEARRRLELDEPHRS